jgi:hypothetical protein
MTKSDILSITQQYSLIQENKNNIQIGSKVKVVVSTGSYNYSTGKTITPEITSMGVVMKIGSKEIDYQGNTQPTYVVKYKNPHTNKVEISEFDETKVLPI